MKNPKPMIVLSLFMNSGANMRTVDDNRQNLHAISLLVESVRGYNTNKGNFLSIIELLSNVPVRKKENDERGKPVKLKICEVFILFREVKDQSAKGLAEEFVHFSTHNLNHTLQDAVRGNREFTQFLKPDSSKLAIKTFNLSRWADKFDVVCALKHRFCNLVKCLSHLTLASKKRKR
ncbi:hypothetical protein PR048_005865 [Dryococelus australis]|uniref:Uncharacterized protein n=1 Tax=Dryococelus australis TaxID=614101 RepID=A0ABQ9IAH0_9NEOP|nr:hypothetical protein PR048_005865 [Dryococelus australis]